MKKGLLFLGLISATFACKVNEKKVVNNTVESDTKAQQIAQKVDRPLVNSLLGKYNFVDSTKAQVFVKLDISDLGQAMSTEKLFSSFRAQWSLQSDYGIKEKFQSGKITFSPETVNSQEGFHYLKFEIPRLREHSGAVLLLELIHPSSGTKFSYDMAIDFNAARTNTRFEIYNNLSENQPRFQTYLKVNEPFVIKSIIPSTEKLYLIRYKNNAKPALAPMSTTKREVLSEFVIEETIDIKDREVLTLKEEGTYMLTQNPENVTEGFAFFVGDERYPRDTNPETLKEALTYMSTSKEIEGLKGFDSSKDAMDMYFLNMAKGDEEKAKKIIRFYFQRVEEANKIFTTYKEGWKTDKGMIYVVMGPPTRVQRGKAREVWVYAQNKNTSEIIYTFYRKPNVFSEQNYDLVRYPEYSAFWYPYIEAWRTGKAAE